jgi:hypothetical protein
VVAGNSSRHFEEFAEVEVDPGGKVTLLWGIEGLSEGSKQRGAVLGVVEKRVPKMDGSARKAAFYLPGLHHLEDLR